MHPQWLDYHQCKLTLIKVARKFGINYSTAKSIVQNHKKKGDHFEKGEERSSDTDECDNLALSC
jgi:transposase